MKEFGCAVRGSPAANSRKQADAHTAPSSTRVASRKALMTPAISALPQLSSGGIEADHVNARELAHRGIEQGGISGSADAPTMPLARASGCCFEASSVNPSLAARK